MALVINTNISSTIAQRNLMNTGNSLKTAMERLSTGCRINHASDDAAGLSLSEKLDTQISGSEQASRNAQDGISMMQIAEGGLSVIHSLLQRARDLSVQAANGVYAKSEKDSIQIEVSQIIEEIQSISQSTTFNDISLLDGSIGESLTDFQKSVITSLQSGWLDDAQNKITTYYGLTPSTFDMQLFFDESIAGGASAYVSSSKYGDGTLAALSLHIGEDKFKPNTGDSGDNSGSSGLTGMYNDMILAHELTHAVIADQIKLRPPTWFNEGCAELLVGRDNQLKVVTNGNDPAKIAGLVTEAAKLVEGGDWNDTNGYFNYSVGYFATKFLEQKLTDDGNSLKDVFDDLQAGDDLTTAIINNTSYTTLTDFGNDIRANGAAYYATLDFTGTVFTTETDTGSIQGLDHGGPAVTAEDSIQSIGFNENPTNFNIIYPDTTKTLDLQIGANVGNTIGIKSMNASILSLGVNGVNVSDDALDAMEKLDAAIEKISTQRSNVGALNNRLQSVVESLAVKSENLQGSNSIIRDADIAKESASLMKSQILQKIGASILAQANQSANMALNLL